LEARDGAHDIVELGFRNADQCSAALSAAAHAALYDRLLASR